MLLTESFQFKTFLNDYTQHMRQLVWTVQSLYNTHYYKTNY